MSLQAATLAGAVLAGHALIRRRTGLSAAASSPARGRGEVRAVQPVETPLEKSEADAALAPARSREEREGALRIGVALRDGFPLFLTKLASNVPGLGLLYIIGFALKGDAVAHYAAAERLLMGSANALWPVMQILMPEIAERRRRDPEGAERLFRRGLFVLVAIGCLIGAVLFVFAPLIVSILFGPKFAPTVEALRVVALALPCIALTNAISNGVLVARGRDWLLSAIIIGSALLSASLALTLIGPDDYSRVAVIRAGVEAALALTLTIAAVLIIRREG